MIHLVFGQNTYLTREAVQTICQDAGSAVRVTRSEAKHIDAAELVAEMSATSMFQEQLVVILDNPLGLKEELEKLLEVVPRFKDSDNHLVFVQEGKVKKADTLFKKLKKVAGSVVEAAPLKDAEFSLWVKKLCKERKITIEAAALTHLIKAAEGDMWFFKTELEKLATLAHGREITLEDAQTHTDVSDEANVFHTIDAIARGDHARAMHYMTDHLKKGESPFYLMSMIAYQFRTLIVVKDCAEQGLSAPAIAKKAGLHPFVVKKSMAAAMQFSMADLKRIYGRLFQADFNMKMGKVKPEAALELFIATI